MLRRHRVLRAEVLLSIILILLLAFCAACERDSFLEEDVPEIEDENEFDTEEILNLYIPVEEFPVLDGSTANIPLMVEAMSGICGISQDEAEQLINCSTTAEAYYKLIEKQVDLLIVYEGDKDVQAGIWGTLKLTPIGRDALVFLTNTANPVDSLTQEQLVSIYSGETVNWSKVGGEDRRIEAYQRSNGSGSQTLFLNLLMKNIVPMRPPMQLRPETMQALLDSLVSYQNEANAIGYSVYYYAKNMYQQPELKFIAVDGVVPSKETIANGEYPLLNNFYVAIRESEPEDSPARKVRNWLLSSKGRQAIEKAGYVYVDYRK